LAAAEYDRLEAAAHERDHLVAEVGELKQRVTALETEVKRLQIVGVDGPRPTAPA
jgi:cell division protein FtsB